ncbi:MAG TPA: hypothetical protein VFU21_07910 [Kofleriaceae bacterium]|nr:hypothetical protein [Kofleriaceae bacterium]
MSRWRVAAAVAPAVLAAAVAFWLWRENRALRAELAKVTPAAAPAAQPAAAAEGDEPAAQQPRRGGVAGFLRGLGRATDRERPELKGAAPEESRAERRRRRQEELRAMLGREPDETVEEYRARVSPMVQTALAVPRTRLEEARREAERAARVTEEQRARIDELFADVSRETLALTNEAIAGGDLTPYERNYAGVLSWAGGLGAILGTTQTRMNEILSPEQRAAMSESGFEWAEYFGVKIPWESLDPPPPPSGS